MKPTQVRAGRPTQKESEARIEHLLDVATRLFIANGYGETSLVGIAGAAQMATRTIYSRYPDKSALFEAVVRRLARSIECNHDHVPLTARLDEALFRMACSLVAYASQPDTIALYKLMFREGRAFPELRVVIENNYERNFIAPLERYFREQMEKGKVILTSPRKLARLFLQIIFGDFNYYVLMNPDLPSAKRTESRLRYVISIFCRGIEEHGPRRHS